MKARGFTLTELLVTMVVLAILGTALAQIILNNARFVSRQDAMMEARESARSAMTAMSFELRMVGDGGLLAASRDSVTVRVPYAFGMTCTTIDATATASVMPTDSAVYATAVPGGLAWRGGTGTYTVINIGGVSPSTNTAACSVIDTIRVVPGGWLIDVNLTGVPALSRPPYGSVFYLFHTVTYRFGASTDLPGRVALWRRAGSAAYEELVAPFDGSARFAFLLGPNLEPSETAPADLNTVRGLELRLVGASVSIPQGHSQPQTFDLETHVAFLNRNN